MNPVPSYMSMCKTTLSLLDPPTFLISGFHVILFPEQRNQCPSNCAINNADWLIDDASSHWWQYRSTCFSVSNTVFSATRDTHHFFSLMESLLIDVIANIGTRGTLVARIIDITYTISAFKKIIEILSTGQRKQCLSDYAIHNADWVIDNASSHWLEYLMHGLSYISMCKTLFSLLSQKPPPPRPLNHFL